MQLVNLFPWMECSRECLLELWKEKKEGLMGGRLGGGQDLLVLLVVREGQTAGIFL